MNINAVLTNNEKLKSYEGKLLNKDYSTQILSQWINKDNILKYENIIQKLKLENIKLEQFSTVLECQENVYNLNIKDMEWYKIYNEIMSLYDNKFELYDNGSIFYFLNIFINWAKVKIDSKIKKYKNIQISENCIDNILINIGLNLTNICSKTIVYEYYNQDYKVFKEFNVKNFNDKKNIEIFLEKYPVMLRRLCVKTKYLLENYLESFDRIDNDYTDIKSIHKICNLIVNIKGNLGDTHAGGKFVIEFEFKNNKKIIYKPKNLFIAKRFYELLSWINQNSNLEKLAIPNNYYNDFYTIEEYIDVKQCKKNDEIRRYYKRIGQLIGLTYHLRGNDFHHENIIASGEYPYLVDLETLFIHSFKSDAEDVFDVTFLNFEESVNSMSFLPSNTAFANKQGQGVDISGLSYADQKLPFKTLQLVGDIDNPRFEYKEFNVKAQNNIPLINNIKIDYRNYKDDIIDGFKDINLFILQNKTIFINKLSIFKDIKVRQLMRNTYDYSKILEYASHPKYTSNMSSFEKILYTLWNSEHYNKSMVTSEINDMIFDDIPIFNTITTNRDLIDSKNNIIKNYFKISAFEYVIDKITNFNNTLLNKQIDYLAIALNRSQYVNKEIARKNNDLFNILSHNNLAKSFDLDSLTVDILKLIEENAIIYNGECIFEHYFKDNIQISINYRNGLCGVFKYLSELSIATKKPIQILFNITKTFLNKKILMLPQFKSIDNIIDIVDILTMNNYVYDDNVLEIINIFWGKLENNIKDKQLNMKEIIKSIDLVSKLYKRDNVYKYKLMLESLKKLLENEILNNGLNIWDELSDVSCAKLLEIIQMLDDLGTTNMRNDFIQQLTLLNNNIILKLSEEDNSTLYNFNEFKNMLIFLNTNLSNNYIEFSKLKLILKKIINNNDSNENLTLIIDILINFLNKKNDIELENLLFEKISKLANYKLITNEYPIDRLNYFKNLSLENGLSGIGYIILRYKNRDISSILELI